MSDQDHQNNETVILEETIEEGGTVIVNHVEENNEQVCQFFTESNSFEEDFEEGINC